MLCVLAEGTAEAVLRAGVRVRRTGLVHIVRGAGASGLLLSSGNRLRGSPLAIVMEIASLIASGSHLSFAVRLLGDQSARTRGLDASHSRSDHAMGLFASVRVLLASDLETGDLANGNRRLLAGLDELAILRVRSHQHVAAVHFVAVPTATRRNHATAVKRIERSHLGVSLTCILEGIPFSPSEHPSLVGRGRQRRGRDGGHTAEGGAAGWATAGHKSTKLIFAFALVQQIVPPHMKIVGRLRAIGATLRQPSALARVHGATLLRLVHVTAERNDHFIVGVRVQIVMVMLVLLMGDVVVDVGGIVSIAVAATNKGHSHGGRQHDANRQLGETGHRGTSRIQMTMTDSRTTHQIEGLARNRNKNATPYGI